MGRFSIDSFKAPICIKALAILGVIVKIGLNIFLLPVNIPLITAILPLNYRKNNLSPSACRRPLKRFLFCAYIQACSRVVKIKFRHSRPSSGLIVFAFGFSPSKLFLRFVFCLWLSHPTGEKTKTATQEKTTKP
jgi:hypothetical protein